MAKLEYKKVYKQLYLPGVNPEIIQVPAIPYVVIEGAGDPNGQGFQLATEALYGLSYAVKMSYKSNAVPEGYYDYTVFPLEGIWDLVDISKGAKDKSNLKYALMIRQPDFLTQPLFERFLAEVIGKKNNECLSKLYFQAIEEGTCCQMMHLGSYDDEPASFKRMETYCEGMGYKRMYHTHREIYISDPRKVEVDQRKTVLRFQIQTN